ncbi:hypothetical protein O3G_MSEX015031 [Manduca sexta]|uniref:RNA-directed DNA polymerase n=1 Tax=Manduca sexta TaxID=7130 RepID=A0A922D1F8_MANSE|nr:hypothetical protein O3G_MSEX015031 [Manduca sexta]
MYKLFRIPRVTCYLDDLTICDVNRDKLWEKILLVFKILSDSGLRVAPEKCTFFQKSISYLGHVIDWLQLHTVCKPLGLHTDRRKVDALTKTPVPTNIRELKAFLGLVNYYGKFVRNLSHVLSPLYDLLKKGNKFTWSQSCEDAFKCVKNAMKSNSILAHFDPQLPITVTCDASPRGVAAVLSQHSADGLERPVQHASRALSVAEQKYAQICREGLAIIFGVTKFHDYIYGRKFTLVTDCKPLACIFNENKGVPLMTASRLQRWVVILGAYNYQVKCITSKHNCVADCLSRLPVPEKEEYTRIDSYINFVQNICTVSTAHVC